MGLDLQKITEHGRSIANIVKAIGPFLVSQSSHLSENYAQHQLRLACVEAAKEYMLDEVGSLGQIRVRLRNSYYSTTDQIERLRLRQDIAETEKELRRFNVINNALDVINSDQGDESDPITSSNTSISEHWLDRFNEYARCENESWRADLLSAALAMEARKSGSVGPRALWLVGTIDEYLFHAFASIVDLSTRIGNEHIIPAANGFFERLVPDCLLGDKIVIGNLTFMLSDLGLIGDILSSYKNIQNNSVIITEYGYRKTELVTKKKLSVAGIILTQLGEVIANLYKEEPNLLGQEIYEKWVSSLAGDDVLVRFIE